ncbi:MAG: hypothetical protein ABJN26_24260 [Stappiaceae bacterium]
MMRWCPVLVLVLLVLSGGNVRSAELTWEVVQPFRFLRFQSDHRIHELAYEEAAKATDFTDRRVSAMEALLNEPAWWNTHLSNSSLTPSTTIEAMRREEGREPETVEPRLGWSSLLRVRENSSAGAGTCWNATTQSFFNCLSDPGNIFGANEYMFPKRHVVKLIITGGTDPHSACRIEVIDGLEPGTGLLEDNALVQSREQSELSFDTCPDHVLARIPYESSLTFAATYGGEVLEPATVKVRDFVVASMGDSFASGEGNPDLPTVLDAERTIRPRYRPDSKGAKLSDFGVPRRKSRPDGTIAPFSSARWVDRRCHRSMYSPHARAAIALALSGDRHHAVTYVSFACSGAEITDGVFWPQDGRECTTWGRAHDRFLEPQIGALVGALGQNVGSAPNPRSFPNMLHQKDVFNSTHLKYGSTGEIKVRNSYCKNWPGLNKFRKNPHLRTAPLKRDIDVLFVSLGGNDMGFAPLVTSTVMTSGATDSIFGDLMAPVYRMAAGGISLDEANERIGHLNQRFAMLALAFEKKLEIDDPGKVVMSLYPSPAHDENEELCASGRRGMNATRLFNLAGRNDTNRPVTIADAQGVMKHLNNTIRQHADAHGFTIAETFVERFKPHGICATSPAADTAHEKLDLPFQHKNNDTWRVFHPVDDFYPYAKRQRWFRTFNDSYLLQQHFKGPAYTEKAKDKGNAFYLAVRTLGGPVHPTAEGHAAIADSLYCAAAAKLLAGQEGAECGN